MKEGVEATLTLTQDQSGNRTKWWGNYPEQTTEQEQERSLKTTYRQKNQLQHNLSTPAQQNKRCGGWRDPQLTSWREGPTKERPNKRQTSKHKDIQRANLNENPRPVNSGDQGDCTTESHRTSAKEVKP